MISKMFVMNRVAGYNQNTYNAAKMVTITGLSLAIIGVGLMFKTVGKFGSNEYELAHEFVDSVMS